MKRWDIEKKLKAAGLDLIEGASHTLIYRNGVRVSTLPRHREIAPGTVRAIQRQTGVRLT